MGIKVALEHRTSYTFDRLVEVHPHVVRLRPAPHSRTPIEAYSLQVEPGDHFINWQQDAFGNFLARLVFPNRTRSLTITVGLIADMKVVNPFDFFIEDWAEQIGFEYPKALAEDLKPYLRPVDEGDEGSGPGDLTTAWVTNFSVAPGTRTIDFLVALNRAVNADVGYSLRMEPGVQTPDFTLRTGIGSCRDSAWLLVSILRQLGLAARFVSGYLVQLTSDVEALDGPSGPAADFTDLHAWTEVYIPGAGWIGLDPTSGLFAGEGHIPLSATPHPASSAPITGATEPCETVLDFSNIVTRVHEDPRVTLPYTEAAWGAICALGARVDERLAAGDVRLTVGGEPTFVSIDNQVDPEWTTDADGPHKRERASALAARLKKEWAPHGLVQRSQGKWYPGEPLPRWLIGLFWRTDGEPLWTNDALLADPWPSGAATAPTSNTAPQSISSDAGAQLLGAIADGLGLPASQVRPAYEDALGRLVNAVRQPAGEPVAAQDDLADDDADRRENLLTRLEQSVSEPAAYVLPLHRRDDESGWASADWQLRRGRIVLLEGDSPAGLRLPLKSISWRPPPPTFEADPLARRADLPVAGLDEDADVDDADTAPTTAMVAEIGERRGGLLYVFLPPTEELEHFVDLITRVEAAAAKIDCPLVIEGYGPPTDPRLKSDERHPRPRRHRGQRRALDQLRRSARPAEDALRGGPSGPVVDGVVRRRRHPRRNRRWQSHHAGRHHSRRLTPVAKARSAGLDADLLAAPPVAVVSVRRPVRRHHLPGAAGRRGPRRGPLRTRDRVRRNRPALGRRRNSQAVGDRSRAAAPADRHHRQHPSRRVLHRQALQPRQRARPAGPAGAAGLRDAPALPDGDGAVTAGARVWWRGSGTSRCGPRSSAMVPTCTADTCCRTS